MTSARPHFVWLRLGVLAVLGATIVALGSAIMGSAGAEAADPVIMRTSPTCGAANQTVTATGSGLAKNDYFSVWVMATSDDPIQNSVSGQSDANGNFRVQVSFDMGERAAVRIKISHGSGSDLATGWYFRNCAKVDATPSTVPDGGSTRVTVGVSGFEPKVPVSLSGLPGLGSITPPSWTSGSGTFTVSGSLRCGDVTITASQPTKIDLPPVDLAPRVAPRAPTAADPVEPARALVPGLPRSVVAVAPPTPPNRTATTTVRVTCDRLAPKVSALPDTFAETALPALSTVTGSGFGPSGAVQLTLDGASVGSATADGSGAFSSPVTLPRVACGARRLVATQTVNGAAVTAEAAITVTCGTAQLTVAPGVSETGRIIQLVGKGFVGGRVVKIEWLDRDGKPKGEVCPAKTDSAGAFTVTCMVMPNTDLGGRTIRAADVPAAGDPLVAREGRTDLLVVPGSMTPGRNRFLDRR